ncbi:MAG: hypothetical protein VX899_13130 [Myxococcota bacterium]|nr:hypothetical protein [Myxococcota bacterium]
MTQLFTPNLLRDLRGMPGAGHSFVKQLAGNGALETRLRGELQRALDELPAGLRQDLTDGLSSLSNPRFFQAFAKLSTARVLQMGGWELDHRDALYARRPGGDAVRVMVVGFLSATDPELDGARIKQLEQSLSRISARTRFVVSVRRWLPQGFDPEPVRQAVELWLREVEAGRWKTRFAAYEDEAVSLEFGLVGGLEAPRRVRGEQSAPLFSIGPFTGEAAMSAIESRVVRELDRLSVAPEGHHPVLLSVVGDQPWRIPPGTLRAFFYGKPRWIQTTWEPGLPGWEACLSRETEPCLYKDPLYAKVVGTLLLHRPQRDQLLVSGETWSNPFSKAPLQAQELPLPAVAAYSHEDERPILRRFPGEPLVALGGA